MNSVNKIKVLFSTLSLVLVAAAPLARAQDAAPPAPSAGAPASGEAPPRGKMRNEPISKVSNLTDEQKAEIKKIREATKAKIKALPDDDNKRAAVRAAMMDSNQQIRALLTDEQKTEFDAAVKEMHDRKKKDGDGAAPPPPAPDAPPSS